MAKIQVRDLDDAVAAGIQAAASAAGVASREAYLRAYLSATFGPEGGAVAATAARFRSVMEILARLGERHLILPPTSLADAARALGHPDVGRLDAGFRGITPLAFEDIDRLCEMYGICREWLDAGRRAPFAQDSAYRRPIDLHAALYRDQQPYREIIFVLSRARLSRAAVYGRRSDYRFDLLLHDVAVHNEIGGGGERALVDFAVLLASIEHIQGRGRLLRTFPGETPIETSGFLIDDDDFSEIVSGAVHPATHLDPFNSGSVWHEDLWDLDLGRTSGYTPAFAEARERLTSVLASKGVRSNADLVAFIREQYHARWQLSDADLAAALHKEDPFAVENQRRVYEERVARAKSDPKGPERQAIVAWLFRSRKRPPLWLEDDLWW